MFDNLTLNYINRIICEIFVKIITTPSPLTIQQHILFGGYND
jgi:hypothetical protein